MKKAAALFLSMLCLTTVWAQSVHIEFQGEPLSYALTQIDGRFPDAHIHFVIDDVKDNTVTAVIDGTKAEDAVRKLLAGLPFAVDVENNNIFIRPLAEDTANDGENTKTEPVTSYYLKEVTILDHTPLRSFADKGIVMDIKGTDLEYRGNAIDVLGYLPGINIGNGEISIRDLDNPSIYIDDIPVNSMSELSSLRSEEIARISLDETANSMYQAQSGTVIRIYTIAPKMGWNVLANALISQGKRNINREEAKVTWNSEALRVSAGFAFQNKNEFQEHRAMELYTTMTPSIPSVNPYLNVSYRWNTQHSLVAKYDMLNIVKDVSYWSGLVQLFGMNYFNTIDKDIQGPVDRREWSLEYAPRHNAQLVYSGKWDKAKVQLDLEYYHDKMNINQKDNAENINIYAYERQKVNGIVNDLVAEHLNIEIPYENFTLSIGNEFTDTKREDSFQNTVISPTTISTERNESQLALYALGEWRFGKKKLHIGLRNEYLSATIEKMTSEHKFRKTYLLPHVDFQVPTESGNWSFAYSARSQRPTYNQLNGYSRFNQYMLFMSGNPDLKPETHHALSAQFRNKVFYANIKYQHISNYIASTVQYDHDAYSMHYDNIPSADEILVNVMYSPKTKYWSPVFSGSLLASNIKMNIGSTEKTFNCPVFFIDLHSPFNIWKNTQLWVDGHFHTTGHIGTALQKHSGTVNLGVARQFGRLNVSLQAEDILKTGSVEFECYGIGTVYNHWNYSDTRRIVFSLNYTL